MLGNAQKRTITSFGPYHLFEVTHAQIVAIENNSEQRIMLGDIVVSNGRDHTPAGMRGVVYTITEPFTEGLSDNCISVRWANGQITKSKFKDFTSEKPESLI